MTHKTPSVIFLLVIFHFWYFIPNWPNLPLLIPLKYPTILKGTLYQPVCNQKAEPLQGIHNMKGFVTGI